MIVAVASGKGGTGKTTIAVNLAKSIDGEVDLVDCDVEEPNAHLFLGSNPIESKEVTVPIPQVDESLCDGCGECSKFCEFHAIITPNTKPIVFPELCHGCGGCRLVCPRGAISETQRRIGVIDISREDHIRLIQGRLDVGVAMAPPLVRAVRANSRDNVATILDAPPGTSCPVITTVRNSDFVLLVTEPTPFGLYDLELAVKMVAELEIPFGVIVNRHDLGDNRVHEFCRDNQIPILLEIPDDRRIAEAYSRGIAIVDALPEYKPVFQGLLEKVGELVHSKEGRSDANL